MSGIVVESLRFFQCEKATRGWEARSIGDPGTVCPWCGEPLDTHNAYDRTITLNGLAAAPPSPEQEQPDE